MQTTGVELEPPEWVEAGVGHEGEGHHGGDDAIVDPQEGAQPAVVPPEGDYRGEEW